MSFLDTLFLKKSYPKPSIFVDDISDDFVIEIYSERYLSEDQKNAIFSVLRSDITKNASTQEMILDVVSYSGFYEQIHIIRTSHSIKVIIC